MYLIINTLKRIGNSWNFGRVNLNDITINFFNKYKKHFSWNYNLFYIFWNYYINFCVYVNSFYEDKIL